MFPRMQELVLVCSADLTANDTLKELAGFRQVLAQL